MLQSCDTAMHLRLIQGGLAHTTGDSREHRFSGEFLRRPDRPPPPREPDSSLTTVSLGLGVATLMLLLVLL